MTTFKVTTPNGEQVTRTTEHDYKYVTFVNFNDGDGWAVSFSATKEGAKKTAAKYNNCPFVKSGGKVTTKVSVIHNAWKPCRVCGKYYCVNHGHDDETM